MFPFSPLAKALSLLFLVSSVQAEPREHIGTPPGQQEKSRGMRRQGHAPMQHPHGSEREDRDARSSAPDAHHWAPGRGSYFTPDHHERARDYFDMPEHRGFVPPGLASKGGVPPGQAKKWRIGQALPREVVFYDLPRPLEIHLGPPPSGYRYVRVATDILLIAVGTGIVMDALENLAR